MAKYILTPNTKVVNGVTVFQIRCVSFTGPVTYGALGGYVESTANLSQSGDSWIYDSAAVYGNANVSGDATVRNSATVYGNAKVYGNATIKDSTSVYGDAKIFDNATIRGTAEIRDRSKVYGNAYVTEGSVRGNSRIYLSGFMRWKGTTFGCFGGGLYGT